MASGHCRPPPTQTDGEARPSTSNRCPRQLPARKLGRLLERSENNIFGKDSGALDQPFLVDPDAQFGDEAL